MNKKRASGDTLCSMTYRLTQSTMCLEPNTSTTIITLMRKFSTETFFCFPKLAHASDYTFLTVFIPFLARVVEMLYKFVSIVIVVEVHAVKIVTFYILQLFAQLCGKVFLFFLVCISIDIIETP